MGARGPNAAPSMLRDGTVTGICSSEPYTVILARRRELSRASRRTASRSRGGCLARAPSQAGPRRRGSTLPNGREPADARPHGRAVCHEGTAHMSTHQPAVGRET
eukprot:3540925-Prymnesium_polylepis.2